MQGIDGHRMSKIGYVCADPLKDIVVVVVVCSSVGIPGPAYLLVPQFAVAALHGDALAQHDVAGEVDT